MGEPPRITWRGGQLRAIKSREFRRYFSERSYQDIHLIAQARQELINFILVHQHVRAINVTQAVRMVAQRIRQHKIPPHLMDAVRIANARPNRIGSITISERALLRWARIYRLSDGDTMTLAPTPSKTLYANDNSPIKAK